MPEFEGMGAEEIRDELIKRGHDGVLEVFWDGLPYGESTVVAFSPTQIQINEVIGRKN
jgi:hypothetical protein